MSCYNFLNLFFEIIAIFELFLRFKLFILLAIFIVPNNIANIDERITIKRTFSSIIESVVFTKSRSLICRNNKMLINPLGPMKTNGEGFNLKVVNPRYKYLIINIVRNIKKPYVKGEKLKNIKIGNIKKKIFLLVKIPKKNINNDTMLSK